MATRRPVSQRVLAEMRARLYPGPRPSLGERLASGAITTIMLAWLAALASTPVLLALVALGRNYVAEWMAAVAWLAAISSEVFAVVAIAGWAAERRAGKRPPLTTLLVGVGLAAAPPSMWLVTHVDQGDPTSLWVGLGARALAAAIPLAWLAARLLRQDEATWRERIRDLAIPAFIVALAATSVGALPPGVPDWAAQGARWLHGAQPHLIAGAGLIALLFPISRPQPR